MKHLILLLSGIISFSGTLTAQILGQSNPFTITGSQNNLKTEIPMVQPAVVGSTYLDENWNNAEIVLKSQDVIKDFPVKIEIEQVNVEIQYKGEVKFLNLKEVDHIRYTDQKTGRVMTMKNATQYTVDGQALKGVVGVLFDGEPYGVVKHFYVKILQANYNVAMDVGSKDHRKVTKEKVYLSRGSQLIHAKGSGKKWASALGSDKEKALQILKDHNLNLTREADMMTFASLLQVKG